MKKYFPHINHAYLKTGLTIAVLAFIVLIAPMHTAHAAWSLSGLASSLTSIFSTSAGEFFGWLIKLIFEFFNYIATLIMELGAQFLDFSIQFVVNGDNYRLGGIYRGWTIFRDLVDMLFIFVILYAAIMTILQLSSFNTRQVIVNLIIVGLLLNFSFFLTGFVIDVGNSTARIIYDAITPGTSTIGATLTRNMNISKVFETASAFDPGQWTLAVAYAMSAVFNLAAAFVFISGAALFVIRYVILAFVLMLSPLAFAALILPQTQGRWKQWLNELIRNTFVAPIYLLVIALVIGIANAPSLLTQSAAAGTAVTTNGATEQLGNPLLSTPGLVINFAIIIGLMVAALSVSKSIAGTAAGVSTKWAGKAVGIGAGTLGFAGRQTLGRGGRAAINRFGDSWREQSKNGGISGWAARQMLRTSDAAQKSSFDARAGKVGGAIAGTAGAALAAGGIKARAGKPGGKGGYEAGMKEKMKRENKFSELLEYSPEKTKALEQDVDERAKLQGRSHDYRHAQTEERIEERKNAITASREHSERIHNEIGNIKAEQHMRGDSSHRADEVTRLQDQLEQNRQREEEHAEEIKAQKEMQKEIEKERRENAADNQRRKREVGKEARIHYGEQVLPRRFWSFRMTAENKEIGRKIAEDAKKTKQQKRQDRLDKIADKSDDIEKILESSENESGTEESSEEGNNE